MVKLFLSGPAWFIQQKAPRHLDAINLVVLGLTVQIPCNYFDDVT